MSNQPQTYANHGQIDPWFHYFAAPVLTFFFIDRVVVLARHPHNLYSNAVFVLLAVALLVLAFRTRVYVLRVQDRVIRLEERLRLTSLLPEQLHARIPELTERQLVALRFASDAEASSLVEKTLTENLAPKAIKQQIRTWRPDYWRV